MRDSIRRGASGVKLAVIDTHEGIEDHRRPDLIHYLATLPGPLPVQYVAHADKISRRAVSTAIASVFAQPDHTAASAHCRLVADPVRGKLPKLATFVDGSAWKRRR